jgi:hypothetical protein
MQGLLYRLANASKIASSSPDSVKDSDRTVWKHVKERVTDENLNFVLVAQDHATDSKE